MAKGFLFVVSGPAGTGKGTICKEILAQNEDIVFSVSATTRKPRPGEEEAINYFFIEDEEFKTMIKEDKFLEYAHVHTNYYGTPKDFVMDKVNNGDIVLLEIDVQGALQIKQNYSEAVFVFILPPTMDALKDRIVKRATETEEDINRRFENAFKELDFVGNYDYFVINDVLEEAVADLDSIIKAEKLRVKRHSDIKNRIISKGGK